MLKKESKYSICCPIDGWLKCTYKKSGKDCWFPIRTKTNSLEKDQVKKPKVN